MEERELHKCTPPKLCKAICRGFKQQLEANRRGQFLLAELEDNTLTNSKDLAETTRQTKEELPTAMDDNEEQMMIAWNDVSGAELDPKATRAARAEEMDCVRKMNLYTKVPITKCLGKTGKQPISVRWIDINKGDTNNPHYRSRLVAREIDTCKRDDLVAATPPLEALKIILSMTACCNKGEIVMINDISRAFVHAKAKREAFVQLTPKDLKPGEKEHAADSTTACMGQGTRHKTGSTNIARNCWTWALSKGWQP